MRRIGFLSSVSATGVSRDFSPEFFRALFRGAPVTLFLEATYGQSFGYRFHDCGPGVSVVLTSRGEVLRQSTEIFSLLSPSLEELAELRADQTILSYLHYATHPERNLLLAGRGCRALSIDSIVDADGKRLVQDFGRVARGAMSSAFLELRARRTDEWWLDPRRGPIVVYIFGAGAVAAEVAKESLRMGHTGLLRELQERGGNPEVQTILTSSVHSARQHFRRFLRSDAREADAPHLVVDAALRSDTSRALLAPADYAMLPESTLLVDVSADDYAGPDVVKGLSGVPTGDDEQWLFEIDDPAWVSKVPRECRLSSANRRVTLSHYSWCSKGPLEAKRVNANHYALQLLPILRSVFFPEIEEGASLFGIPEAIERGTLECFLRKELSA